MHIETIVDHGAGRRDVTVLLDGPDDWSAACGVPLEHGDR